MFDFRIVDHGNGVQTFDMSLKTPYNSLTPMELLEYEKAAEQIYTADRIRRQERKRHNEDIKRKKMDKNPIWRLAAFCGLV